MLHENGDPGTGRPLNFTDSECDAASVGRKLTLKRAFPSDCTKFGTFLPLTATMISKLPAPA